MPSENQKQAGHPACFLFVMIKIYILTDRE